MKLLSLKLLKDDSEILVNPNHIVIVMPSNQGEATWIKLATSDSNGNNVLMVKESITQVRDALEKGEA